MEENTPDLESTTGYEDLRAALGATAPWDGDESTDDESVEESTNETPKNSSDATDVTTQSPEDDAAAPDDEEIGRVLKHPGVQERLRQNYQQGVLQAVNRAVAEARRLWDAELAQRASQEEELLLDDEEYGRRIREQQKIQPVLQRAQAAGYARAQQEFFHLGVGSVFEAVPELKTLDNSKRAELNPMDPKYRTYGEYVNALVDYVANQRAEKLAQSRADAIVQARLADARTKDRKHTPSPRGVPGPASAPGPIIDVDQMSGEQLLRAAFSN